MAENESLDLGQPGGRRWLVVYSAIRKGEPLERIAEKAGKRLYGGLRAALTDLSEQGVSLADLLAARDSATTLKELVEKSRCHDYAVLFAQTAVAEDGTDSEGVLAALVSNVWDKIADQIAQNVVGNGPWTNIVDVQILLNRVRDQIEPDIDRIAFKLAEDPTWEPRSVGKKDGETDPTAEALRMSLLGIRKQ